jgi:hypothetical protein
MNRKIGFFVNVYEIYNLYGGPEEGGWWYEHGEPIESVRCDSMEEAVVKRDELDYGNDISVRIERRKASAFPKTRPCYN